MPQIINVPNYGDVEFPDDMSDSDIASAIKKNALGYKKPANTKLTFAEKNIAPVLDNLDAATGRVMSSQPVQDMAVGASGLFRGGANLIKPNLGEKIWPSSNSSGGGYETIGSLLDPVAIAAGNEAFQLAKVGAPYVKGTAEYLMQSALKPTIADLKKGNAAIAVKTLLDEGINATKGGVAKLRDKIATTGGEIDDLVAKSNANVSRPEVMKSLDYTRNKFMNQVSPQGDLQAIENVASDFMNHPGIVQRGAADVIPVQQAQALKSGTQNVVSKKYGQIGNAETEAQKSLARGLREQISQAIPEISPLNAREAALIKTLNVTERRALMDANKNPMGLALLANNPAGWAAFMADKSALFKSLAARSVNQASKILPYGAQITGIGAANSYSDANNHFKGLLSD